MSKDSNNKTFKRISVTFGPITHTKQDCTLGKMRVANFGCSHQEK